MTMLVRDAAAGELAGEVEAMRLDEDAFRGFYDRTSRPLWAYLSRMTGDAHVADDILQEAYYRFCRANATHESEEHRRHSLFHIATNLLRDRARRNRGIFHLPLADLREKLLSVSGSGERIEKRMDLHRALDTLDERQREMLWLAYAQGESHADIAKIYGIREQSVRTILLRARRRMAKLLRKEPATGEVSQ